MARPIKQLIFFYAIMKRFVADVTEGQLAKIESVVLKKPTYDILKKEIELILKSDVKREKVLGIFDLFQNEIDINESTLLAINYLKFKDFILSEKSKANPFKIVDEILKKKFSSKGINNPSYKLTMEFDNYTTLGPYSDRVFSAWLLNEKSKEKVTFQNDDVLNNVFQIILDESIMQSGRSNSGGDYEGRIAELFQFFKLDFTKHHHEEDDQSQEHDFLVTYKNKKIGVGAKGTLRERYKQYNPEEVDFSIVFTIGEDLNEPKTKTITETYKSFIFVADEIYNQNNFLKDNKKVFKSTRFSLDTLDQIIGGIQ